MLVSVIYPFVKNSVKESVKDTNKNVKIKLEDLHNLVI